MAERRKPNQGRREADELVTALLIASRALIGLSARSIAEVPDAVTPAQFRTLVVLASHGPTRLNTLAARLEVNASSALRTVDRLVPAGLVTREPNPDDRREVIIGLTDEGSNLVTLVTENRRTSIARIVGDMPVASRRAFIDALDAFNHAADEPGLDDAATQLGW